MSFSTPEGKLDVKSQSCSPGEHRGTAVGCSAQQLEHKVPLGSSCSAAGAGLAPSSSSQLPAFPSGQQLCVFLAGLRG